MVVGVLLHVDFVLLELRVEFVLCGRVGGEVVEGVAEDETCGRWLVCGQWYRWRYCFFTEDFSRCSYVTFSQHCLLANDIRSQRPYKRDRTSRS